MKVSDYKTGMILKENNDYFLVLGMYAYEIEETKRDCNIWYQCNQQRY